MENAAFETVFEMGLRHKRRVGLGREQSRECSRRCRKGKFLKKYYKKD